MRKIYSISAEFKVEEKENLKNRIKETARIKIKNKDFKDRDGFLFYKVNYEVKAKNLKKAINYLGNRIKSVSYCKCLNWNYEGAHNK